MTIITVISQQPLTTEQVNSFRSVPVGGLDGQVLTKASNNNFDVVWEDAGGSSSTTNLSIANKTTTTFDILSSTGTDATLPSATITEAGLLIATDKVKLNNLGTASYLNVPASGNAASGEVVKGNDTRLSDARTPLSHSHVIADVTGLQTTLDGKFNNPTGDTTQYIAGDGSLIAFPVAGQAGTLVRQVRNETGSTLTKGTVIYLSGASGNKPLALRAIANSEAASDRTFGIVQADISNNSNGYAVVSGDLVGVDTSSLTEGSIVYLSGTVAGGVTTTQPVSPLHSVVLGVVTRSHVTQGQFDVSIQNGFEIEDLHDILITSKTNKDVLRYESSTGLWKNVQLATSDVTGLDTALSGKQPLATVLTNTTASFTTSLETKLNGVATGATANSSDATLLARANHTGTQLSSTISDFNTAADARVVAGITGKENTITAGTTAQYWRGDKSWQTLNSTAVGLGNVDNTSDTSKPISTATQTALNLKYDATNPSGYTSNTGTVTTFSFTNGGGFTGTVGTAGTTPILSLVLQNATTGQSGQLTSTDWNTFNGKQASDSKLTSISSLSNVTTGLVKLTNGVASFDSSTYLTGNQTITVTGDVSGSGTTAITLNLGSNVVTNAKLAQMATATIKGRITAGTGAVEDLTASQATSLLDVFTTSSKGLVGASGGGTANFLRADGAWANPAGGSAGITRTVVVSSGSFTAGATSQTDYVYLIAGAHNPTMPTAVSNTNRYTFKNNHSANITIDTTSSQTIDGTTTISVAPQDSVDLISDNANWSVI